MCVLYKDTVQDSANNLCDTNKSKVRSIQQTRINCTSQTNNSIEDI